MTRHYIWRELDEDRKARVLRRPAVAHDAVNKGAADIVREVRQNGDSALYAYTERFDSAHLDRLEVSREELEAARAAVEPETLAAMERAAANITRFHAAQRRADLAIETEPGVLCERVVRPIARVGLYVPGGTAPLASTVLMLGIPARLAGCETRVMCTPPSPDGSINPNILLAAELTGITAIYKIGGAQAIAALAFGTATVPKVDKIFGPGNAWVTAAKQLVAADADGAASDMPAGPSEVLVIADHQANPAFVAADLLSQAEHGQDSQVILVSTSADLFTRVSAAIEAAMPTLARAAFARQSLEHSLFLEAASLDEAVEISNRYAPEHLIIHTENARALATRITAAGSVFLGPWSPESVGDYASGTNHVLPTYGHARAFSGLTLEAFEKTITVQELSAEGLRSIAPSVETLAAIEGLDAHLLAVRVRRELLESERRSAEKPRAPLPGAWIDELARPTVRDLAPYSSARSMVTFAPVLLDANENPWSPLSSEPSINRYPSPQPAELLSRLAGIYGTSQGHLIAGRGTDDVIDWLLRAFCESGKDAVIVCPPTYGVYRVFAELQGARVDEVPLGPWPTFEVDVEAVLAAVTTRTKLVFLCSPNNPTGGVVSPEIVTRLVRALANRALVVLDEAYVELADSASQVESVAENENLVVLRTLSKAYGLAGARCGVGIAHQKVISILNKVRAPYPLPSPVINAVLEATDPRGLENMRLRVAALKAERARLHEAIAALPITEEVLASQANFLLARFADGPGVVAACRAAGVIVRDRGGELGLKGCVRISIGTPDENNSLLAALQKYGS